MFNTLIRRLTQRPLDRRHALAPGSVSTTSLSNPSACYFFLLLGLALMVGCTSELSTQLEGEWVGHPDTEEAQRKREMSGFGEEEPDESEPVDAPSVEGAATDDAPVEQAGDRSDNANKPETLQRPPTDWQQYEVALRMKFRGEQVMLSKANSALLQGPEEVKAAWSVIEQTPASMVLEFRTEKPGKPSKRTESQKAAKQSEETDSGTSRAEPNRQPEPEVILRRFQLLPTLKEEKLVGFSFRELEADRQVGSLYFTRPE